MVLAEWTAHPARRRPRDVFLVLAVLFCFCGAVVASLRAPWLAGLAAIILTIALAPFWFPTRYRLTEDGVFERRLGRQRSRRWQELRRLEIGTTAALLSPFARPHVLDRYRGVWLLFDGGDRAAIVDILREKLDAPR